MPMAQNFCVAHMNYFIVIKFNLSCKRWSASLVLNIKPGPVFKPGAFSTRLHFTAGNTPCRKINQSTTSIHSVPSVLVFRTAQVENTQLKCSGDVSLGNESKNKSQTHTQESLYDTYFKHGVGWHTTQYGKGYCQQYDDFQGNNGHFIGDWLNIVYRYFNNTPRNLSRFPNERSLYSSAVLCFILFQTSFPQPFSTIRSLAMAYHVIPVNCGRISQQLPYHVR